MNQVSAHARRRYARGSIAVEFTVVTIVLAVAVLAPWGGEASVADRLLDALIEFWQGFARIVARL
jgi:hypothetical protein